MYNYSLRGYEDNVLVTHENKYTKKQFEKMCKEAPLYNFGMGDSYDIPLIMKYLKKKYGFKELVYTTGFFADAEVK